MNYFQRVRINERSILFTQFIQEIKRCHLLWRQDMALITVLSGEAELYLGGESSVLHENDVVLISPNQTFSTLSRKKGTLAMFLYFDPGFYARYLDSVPALFCRSDERTRNETRYTLLRGILASLMRLSFDPSPEALLSIEARYTLLLDLLLKSFRAQGDTPEAIPALPKKSPALESIVEYINVNYKKDIALRDIADIGGYNPSYVSHLFKEKMGIGFREYLTRRRLQSAIADINHTDKSMTDVAHSNGFADVKSFYLNFESMYGRTPLQYKKEIMAGDFSKIRLANPQSQHNYSEARVVYPNALAERKLEEYISAVPF